MRFQGMAAILSTFALLGCETPVAPQAAATEPAAQGQALQAASGFGVDAVAAIITINSRIAVYLEPGKATPDQIAKAPARLCDYYGKSVASVEDIEPAHPGTLPGTLYLVIHCT